MGLLVFLFLGFIGVAAYLIYKSCQEDKTYSHFSGGHSSYYDDDFDSDLFEDDQIDDDLYSNNRNSYKGSSSYNSPIDLDPYSLDPSRSMYLGEDGDILENL